VTTDQTVSIDGVDYANDGLWERHEAGTGQVRHARRNTRPACGAHALELGRPGYLERPVLQKADPKLVYAAQVRAARALLGWSQGDLAERAGISKQTVNRERQHGRAVLDGQRTGRSVSECWRTDTPDDE